MELNEIKVDEIKGERELNKKKKINLNQGWDTKKILKNIFQGVGTQFFNLIIFLKLFNKIQG